MFDEIICLSTFVYSYACLIVIFEYQGSQFLNEYSLIPQAVISLAIYMFKLVIWSNNNNKQQ